MPSPVYVFLDQNHWIYLAKEFWGKAHKPAHKGIAKELLARVEHNQVRLPLNVIHLIEHLRDERPDRRKRLAQVFESFSRGWFFASWTDIIAVEISRAVAQAFHSKSIPSPPKVFGKGFLFGIGPWERDLVKRSTKIDLELLNWLTAQRGQLLDLLTFPNESGRLRQKRRTTDLDNESVAAAEKLRKARKSYDKALHRRAQYASYTEAFQNRIAIDLRAIDKSPDDFLALGLDDLIDFWLQVPSLDADCELTLYRERQWSREIQGNDIRDIGHLALAIPYCSIVVVERFWARALQETGLAVKYGNTVCTDLTELQAVLSG